MRVYLGVMYSIIYNNDNFFNTEDPAQLFETAE